MGGKIACSDVKNMSIFASTLNQLIFLFGLIFIGYILVKLRVLDSGAASVLSKLENNLFIPALVMGTFIENFTVERIVDSRNLIIVSFLIMLIVIPFAIITSKIITKDRYIRNIYTYGLSFSNFGFMGNAVVSSLFPDMFFEYLIFTLPIWIIIYLWGVPVLLLSDSSKKRTFKESLKTLVNPMFAGVLAGMIIGISGIKLHTSISSIISVSGNCMSPVAMLLTGMILSDISIKKTFTDSGIYLISAVRLVVLPLLFIGVSYFVPMSRGIFICSLCSLAMPLGLNTIVVPSALGKDTSKAAGMALISHIMSLATIPLIFIFIS